MKKILSVIILVLSLTSCVKEVFDVPGNEVVDLEGKVTLNFSVMVPDAQNVSTKSLSSQEITSLTVIVFDERGYKVEAVDVVTDYTVLDTNNSEKEFSVKLSQSSSPRTLHFVANSPRSATELKDLYGTEAEIMTQLVTSYDSENKAFPDAYWQCVKVNRLLEQEASKLCGEKGPLYQIPLIRNFAKINVVVGDNVPFELSGFELINIPTRGTVAPYNTSAGAGFFQKYYDDNKKGLDYDDLNPDYRGFMPMNFDLKNDILPNVPDDSYTWNPNPKYTYERTYGATPTAVLIKGSYSNNDPTYYKAELYGTFEGMPHNYDILRNIEYTITITNVLGDGYDSAAAAAENVAGNNINNSIETANYSNISDGNARLFVEYISKRVVSNNQFTLKYKFVPDISKPTSVLNDIGGTDGKIQISFNAKTADDISTTEVDETGFPVIKRNDDKTPKWSIDTAYGVDKEGWSQIIITPNDQTLGQNTVLEEDLTLTATTKKDGQTIVLSRTVHLSKRNPYPIEVSCPDVVANNSLGQQVEVKTYIPTGLDEFMFPLVFAIEASALSLYPDPTATNVLREAIVMPVVSGASIISSKNSFYYERTLTYDEYEKLGTDEVVDNESGSDDLITMKVVPSYFLTNKAKSDSYVYVYNEYFGLDSDSFTTQTLKLFTNLAFPDGVKAQADAATTFTFNAEEANRTVTVKLQGLYRLINNEKVYEFTVNSGTNGAVSITDLKTERASGTVKVSLSADGYAPTSLSAEQANRITIATSATISFTRQNRTTPDMVENIDVAGGNVSYESFTIGGSGDNRTIKFTNIVFEGSNLSNSSEVTIVLNYQRYVNAYPDYARVTITTTIGDLKGN